MPVESEIPTAWFRTKPSGRYLLFRPENGGLTFFRNIANVYQTSRYYNPDQSNLYCYRHEKLKSNGVILVILSEMSGLWISFCRYSARRSFCFPSPWPWRNPVQCHCCYREICFSVGCGIAPPLFPTVAAGCALCANFIRLASHYSNTDSLWKHGRKMAPLFTSSSFEPME
jgi:hypothetical protein